MTKHSRWLALATAAVLASSVAHAGAPVGSWYVAPQALHVNPYEDYEAINRAWGGALSVGKVLTEHLDVNLGWMDTRHGVDGGGQKVKIQGPAAKLNLVFMRNSPLNPYLGLGVDYVKTSFANSSQHDLGGEVHAGVLANLTRTGALQLFAEVGEHLDGISDSVNDRFAGLGMRMNFGGAAPAAPVVAKAAPAPAPAAPVAPPAPADSDHDGVLDTADQCPNTVAGAKVDARGCELDSDKDGVVDRLDKCPATPAGDKVDAVGCSYNMPLQVTFDTNKATIKSESNAELDKFVQFMKDVPSARGELQGHTDSDGGDKANLSLSQRRADAIKAHIVNAGIDAERVTAKGYGESQPIADNKTAEGKAANRRVVFVRLDK